MWAAYILYLDGHYPKIRNEKAWVLALDGFYRERNGKDVDWRALADEAGATLRTMQMRRGKLMRPNTRSGWRKVKKERKRHELRGL